MKRSLAILAVLGLTSGASAQLLNGASLDLQWYSPNFSTPFGFPTTVVVGPGVELPGYFFGIVDIDITNSQLIASFRAPNTFNPGTFNGFLLQDVTANLPAILSVSLNGSTNLAGFNASRVNWSVDTFGINLQNLTVANGDRVVLDIVAAPSPGSLALLGLGSVLILKRRRA